MKARIPAPREAARAPRGNRVALPHAAAMQRRFGPRVAHVPVFAGPPVAAILAARKADAAALDGAIFLKDARAPAEIVAHELAHALQQYRLGDDVSTSAMLHALAVAPVLPAASLAEAEARDIAAAPGPAAPVQALAPGVAALRRTPVSPGDRMDPGALAPTAVPAPGPEPANTAPVVGLAPPAPAAPLHPSFVPPEAPDTTLDPAIAEARAAAAAEAEAAMAAATTPSAAMAAYATMAPSQQGLASAGLGAKLGDTASSASATLIDATPDISIAIDAAAVPLPEAAPLALTVRTAPLVPDVQAATVVIPEAPVQPVLQRPQNVARTLEQRFAEGATRGDIFATIRAIQAENPGVVTRIGDRARLPPVGDTTATLNQTAANTGTEAARLGTDATTALINGRGPEAVVPRSLSHVAALPEIEPRPVVALAAPPEAAELERLALPPEVVAGFDTASAAQMAASTAEARTQMAKAEADQMTAHTNALGEAETGRAAAEKSAQTGQHDIIVAQREAVQAERQQTVTAQEDGVAKVEADAEAARLYHDEKVVNQVAADRHAIDAKYNAAEAEADAKVATGEERAREERAKADKKAADEGWWDRAAGFIGDVFDALINLVADIFNAIRDAVTALFDLVRDAVNRLISIAAAALNRLITALGNVLQGLITVFIGTFLPKLADKLNGYIEDAVNTATTAIDDVADRMKAAVNAVVDRLKNAINSLLDVFQTAINAALALAQAAITGDWAGLFKKVLDAVLRLLGIEPESFYAMLAQASNAIETIVDDPGGFVQNLVNAVTGGIQRFVDNFGEHLQRGILRWLTGALGNLTLPERWDLAGVLDLARQVTGLTWDFVRERATRLIGAANVERLEAAFEWVETLVREGFPALFAKIYDGLNDLTGGVLEAIRSFLVERVLLGAITWITSLFNPAGALVKLVMTIWNIYQFLKNQLACLLAIVTSVVESLAQIAAGVLEPAMITIERVLGNLLPVAIDLLMSLLGVTGVAARVREILQMVRDRIAAAIDALISRALALFRGEAATGADAGPAAANDNSLGEAIAIDVEHGPDHTLSIERGGAGGATVMLRSEPLPLVTWLRRLDPLVGSIQPADKKQTAVTNIALAHEILDALEKAADKAANVAASQAPTQTATKPAKGARGAKPAAKPAVKATTEQFGALVATEKRLAPVLVAVFNAVDGAGGEFADLYTDEILLAHEKARDMIRQELRTKAATFATLTNWGAVVGAMKTGTVLFTDPLDGARVFGKVARDAIEAAIIPVAPATANDPAEVARILTHVRQLVRADDGAAFKALRSALHQAILDGHLDAASGEMTTAIAAARTDLGASTEVDVNLRAAIDDMGLDSFLLQMAANATIETKAGGKIGPVEFDALWKAKGGANKDFIASRFRSPKGLHEWIPTNYIPQVLARARQAKEEEGIEFAALWLAVHDAWRTDTEVLIYKPAANYTRDISVGSGAAKRDVAILQGHVGAIYAKADDTGVIDEPQQQTIGQGPWHDELRTIFDVDAAAKATSEAALASVIANIDKYARATIWAGDTAVKGLDATIFDEYYDSGRTRKIGVKGVKANAARAFDEIKTGFDKARTAGKRKAA